MFRWQRFFALFLCVTMFFSTVPVQAEETTPTDLDFSQESALDADVFLTDEQETIADGGSESSESQDTQIMPLSLDVETEIDNRIMSISVDDVVIGKSFTITWNSVSRASHYEISIVRIGVDGSETHITSGTNYRENLSRSCSYTVPAAQVPEGTSKFRIYVGAAGDEYPCDWTRMLKENTVTVTVREGENHEMDVKVMVDEDGARVKWDAVSKATYYLFSAYDITSGTYIYNRDRTTKTYFDIDADDVIDGHKYRLWVGAYTDGAEESLAQHLTEITLLSVCYHAVTMHVDHYGYYQYEEIDDTYHEIYNVYDIVCKACEEILEKNLVESLGKQEHTYSTEGVCTVCHYAGGDCIHVSTHPVITKTDYKPEGPKTHTKIEHFDLVCDYCGAIIPLRNDELYERDRENRTEGLAHSFKNGVCEYCSYVKADELTVTVQRGQAAASVGDTISASASIAGGSGTYRVVWKVYCDGICLNDDITGAWISGVEHSASYLADRVGDWYFEAWVYDSEGESVIGKTQSITVTEDECDHDYRTVERTDLIEYEKANDVQHRVRHTYESVCALCGDVRSSWISDEFENHDFDANGKCICGAIEEKDPDCVHEWESTVVETRVEQTQRNDRMEKHMVMTVYADVCAKCGSESSHETVQYVAHVFDKNGECECGYIQPAEECDHAVKETLISTVYTQIDENKHLASRVYHYECDCGLVSYDENSLRDEVHTYIDGFCACGREGHVHTLEEVFVGTAAYTNLNTAEHSVTTTRYMQCTTCDYRTESESVTWTEPHNYASKGHIEIEHQNSLGHATFNRCVCGAVEYTGYSKYANCCDCVGHHWGTAYLENNEEWRHKCSRCGAYEVINAPNGSDSIINSAEGTQDEAENRQGFTDAARTKGNELNDLYDEINRLGKNNSFYHNLVDAMLEEQSATVSIFGIEIPSLQVLIESAYSVLNVTDWDELKESLRKQIIQEYINLGRSESLPFYYGLMVNDDDELFEKLMGINLEIEGGDVYGSTISTGWDIIVSMKNTCEKLKAIDNATEQEKLYFSYLAADVVDSWCMLDQLERQLGGAYAVICQDMKQKLLESAQNSFSKIGSESKAKRDEAWREFGTDVMTSLALLATSAAAEEAAIFAQAVENMAFQYGDTFISTNPSIWLQYNSANVVAGIGSGIDISASILAGIKIGNMLTPAAGELIDAKHTMIALVPMEVMFRGEMTDILYHNSQDDELLYMYTKLYLSTRKIGLEAAKAYGEKASVALKEEEDQIDRILEQLTYYYNEVY